MRTLVIAGEYPWPENTGSRIRLAIILRGLQRCGPTELFSVVSKFRDEFDPPDGSQDLAKVGRVGFDNRPPSALALVPALLRPGTPIGLPRRDRAQVQRAIARFMSGRYDLVWFFGPRPWGLAGQPVFAPTVLDLIDLEDEKILARLSGPSAPPAGAVGRVRRAAATAGLRGRGPAVAPAPPAKQPTDRGGGGEQPPRCGTGQGCRRRAGGGDRQRLSGRRPSGRTTHGGHAADRPVPGPPPVPSEHRRRPVAGRRDRPLPAGTGPRRGDPVGRGPPARTRRPRRSSPAWR